MIKTQLTYADREALLQTLDSLKASANQPDDEVIKLVSQWVKKLPPRFGIESSLTRDITILTRYLVAYKEDEDISSIARGALLHILNSDHFHDKEVGKRDLLGDIFVCSYAAYEINLRLGKDTSYNPLRLTETEQKRAENLFLEFVEDSAVNDETLIRKAKNIIEDLKNLTPYGLFQRFRTNIAFLISVLDDKKRDNEQKIYAHAALKYLIYEEDSINDQFGLIGYLDDAFILQLAVDFIEPSREPWTEVIYELFARWPFLNDLSFDDGTGAYPLSEYMLINSALTCTKMHDNNFPSTVLLITPSVGPTSYLLGIISTCGLLQESAKEGFTEKAFTIGQKVLIESAVAEFAGFRDFGERKCFGLRQYSKQHGHKCENVHYWPISSLSRLVPADSSRVPRGKLVRDLGGSDRPLSAIEYLFHNLKSIQLSSIKQLKLATIMLYQKHS